MMKISKHIYDSYSINKKTILRLSTKYVMNHKCLLSLELSSEGNNQKPLFPNKCAEPWVTGFSLPGPQLIGLGILLEVNSE